MAGDVTWTNTTDVEWINTADVEWSSATSGRGTVGPFGKLTALGLSMQLRTFIAKTESVSTFTHMRGMILPIEYEQILEDVSPSDTEDLANIGMLYIGTTGDVKVDSARGDTVTLKNVPSGTWLNFCRVKKVYDTGTTADHIVLAR